MVLSKRKKKIGTMVVVKVNPGRSHHFNLYIYNIRS